MSEGLSPSEVETGWFRITMDGGTQHVVPAEDGHDADTTCPCGPRVEFEEGGMIVVHNSYDGREAVEWAQNVLD